METNTITATPTIGEGATISFYSDRKAGTVIAVSPSGKHITIQLDDAVRIDNNGMSESQTYEFTPNTNNGTLDFSLRKDGRFHEVGAKMYEGARCFIGNRSAYYDFSF